jgi:hypothetical protein
MKWKSTIKRICQWFVKDRETDRIIRTWLKGNGYNSSTAALHLIELFAIQRPGWKQIYRVCGNAENAEGVRVPLFAVVNVDERRGAPEVVVFHKMADQVKYLRKATEGFIIRRGALG